MANRIEERLASLKDRGEKALITYMTAGLPDMETTKALILAQEEAGVDILELGVPFSDPIADGPVIQAASFDAICAGSNLAGTFACVKELRKKDMRLPIVLMLYFNTILHGGIGSFVKNCRDAGVDGLIVPDLPFEEQGELLQALKGDDQTILIELVSPLSGDRVPMITKHARGFIYCVSSLGVTGQEGHFYDDVIGYLSSVKACAKIPVMMGFGIRTAADVAPMKDVIDGAIVGSHFIELLRENDFSPAAAAEYCRTFKREQNALP